MQARMNWAKLIQPLSYRAVALERCARKFADLPPQTISNNQRGQVEARLVLGYPHTWLVQPLR